MMDKYFRVSNMLFFVNSNFIFLKKKKRKERCDFITKHLTDFLMLCFIIGFNHVRQIQNKAELKIINMMNT